MLSCFQSASPLRISEKNLSKIQSDDVWCEIFATPDRIRTRLFSGLSTDVLPPPVSLDNVGTTRSVPTDLEEKARIKKAKAFFGQSGQKKAHDWKPNFSARSVTRYQVKEILSTSKKNYQGLSHILNKAAAKLDQCGKTWLVSGTRDNFSPVHSYRCKLKYCPRCARDKRNILLARFWDFFGEDGNSEVRENFDLALLTVTLRHGEHTKRNGWYFEELKNHFSNSLKYGAFREYIKGGIYTTEITHTNNGFHIHRHALVLIPKVYNFRATGGDGLPSVGEWRKEEGKWKFYFSDTFIVQNLVNAWHKKTGDSFHLDLKPLNPNVEFQKSILEVFKYVAKPGGIGQTKEGKKVIPGCIIAEMERRPRAKFLNRFGILYKEKSLAINQKRPAADVLPREADGLSIATQLFRTRTGKYRFKKVEKFTGGTFEDALKCLAEQAHAGKIAFFGSLAWKSLEERGNAENINLRNFHAVRKKPPE